MGNEGGERLEARYKIIGSIGAGSYAKVHIAFDRERRENVALKEVNLARAVPARVLSEVELWKKCAHRNIIRLNDTIFTPSSAYLSLELADGGEILDKIDQSEEFDEEDAQRVVRQCVAAVAYLHDDLGIAHRDLKPENILTTNAKDGSIDSVKLADFGFATWLPAGARDEQPSTVVGTPEFMAPEQIRLLTGAGDGLAGLRHDLVDCWALGCIAYELLSGSPPFLAEDDDELYDMILNKPIPMASGVWETASDLAKDFIYRLLQRDPARRLTAREALDHPWLKGQVSRATNDLALKKTWAANREKGRSWRAQRRLKASGHAVTAVLRLSVPHL